MGEVSIIVPDTECGSPQGGQRAMTPPGYERRHGQKERDGTWEAQPTRIIRYATWVMRRRALPIRKRRGRKLAWESDEAIVPRMGMKQNIPVGKGLC